MHDEAPSAAIGVEDRSLPPADVVVAGAGPAGLALSLRLAHLGHEVVLVERWPAPYPLPRAVGLDHESRRFLNRIAGRERLEPLLAEGPADSPAEFLTHDRELLLAMPMRDRSESGGPEFMAFNQPDLERLLVESVEQSPRIRLLRGVMVTDADDRGEAVDVRLQETDEVGMPREDVPSRWISARFLVGADGAQSTVRRIADLPLDEDLGFSSDWLVVDIRPHRDEPWSPYSGQFLAPPRPTTCVPAGPGRRRFEFMLLPGEAKDEMESAERTWELLEQYDVTPDRAALVRHVAYTFHARWATEWRRGRVLLAGDAAHQMPPFLAQGLNSSIRDVATLSWRLDLALRGLVSLETLDDYAAERVEHVGQIIREAVGMGAMLCELDPQRCAERDERMRLARDAGGAPPLRQPWRIGAVAAASEDPHAGVLGRHGTVHDGEREGWFDDLVDPGSFVLLSRDGDAEAALSPRTLARWRELGGRAVELSADSPVRDADGDYAAWFAEWDRDVILVRPDFYVFGTAASASEAESLVGRLLATLPQPSLHDTRPTEVGQKARTLS